LLEHVLRENALVDGKARGLRELKGQETLGIHEGAEVPILLLEVVLPIFM
jgi:hypothetical protein